MQAILKILRHMMLITTPIIIVVTMMVISDKFDLLDISGQKTKLEKILNNLYNVEFDLNNKISLRFFPAPHLSILSLSATQDNIQLFKGSSVKIFPILSSLLTGLDSTKFKKYPLMIVI